MSQVSQLPILGVSTARAGGRTKTQTFFRGHCHLGQLKGLQEALVFDPKCPLPLTKNSKVAILGNLNESQNVKSGKHWTISSRDCPFLTGPLFASHLLLRLPSPHQGNDPHTTQRRINSLLHEETVDGLLLPHHLDNLPVQVDKECSPEATGDTGEREEAPSKRRSSFSHLLLSHTSAPSAPHPITAKAGSSWRSKGKSSRNRVLNRAVMVSEGKWSSRGRWV